MFTARTVSRAAAATGALAFALLAAPLPAAATEPYGKNCADYPTRAAAQAAFIAHGGSPTNNWHGLDNDHDGQACEHHRFPGQPTPPPNPGPSGCAVCSPTPAPSPSDTPTAPPQPSGSPGPPTAPPSPPVPPVSPPPVTQPPAPPELPRTGSSSPAPAVAGTGAGALLLGAALLALGRRRRA